MELKISIITPNYNYSRYIELLIESIVNQNYSKIEHIIVDDGSTDNSVEIIKNFQNKYPQIIKLIKQENKGQSSALNSALRHVSGDILGWINSDDLYCENVFGKIISIFQSNPNIDVLFGNIKIIDAFGKEIKENKYLNFNYLSGLVNGFGRSIPSNGVFWKSHLSKEIGFFDESFSYVMDGEYWSRLLFNRSVLHLNYPIAKWRQHENAKTFFRQKTKSKAYKQAELENRIIAERDYIKLAISRYFAFKYFIHFKPVFKFSRVFLRFINGHYFKKK